MVVDTLPKKLIKVGPFTYCESVPKEAICTPAIQQRIREMEECVLTKRDINEMTANQFGEALRIVTIAETQSFQRNVLTFINPRLVYTSMDWELRIERCINLLSRLRVERPHTVVFEALDKDGEPITIEGAGLRASRLMHGFDHINGVSRVSV